MEKKLKTVVWSGVERFGTQLFQALFSLALARLLCPDDFGLMAMLNIYFFLAQTLSDSGIPHTLIQKNDRKEIDFSTGFYFNLSVSLSLYVVLFAFSPMLARFYGHPELNTLLKVTGLCIPVLALAMIPGTLLTLRLDFKKYAQASIFAMIMGGLVAVGLAFAGYGVWALSGQILTNSIAKVLILWYQARWMPRTGFSWSAFRSLFSMGSRFMGATLIDILYKNSYAMLIGKQYQAHQAGYYSQAFSLGNLPSSNIAHTIARALYPIQCEIQHDSEALLQSLKQFLRACSLLVWPCMIFAVFFAEDVIHLVLGSQWTPSAPYLRILCVGYFFYPFMVINNQMLFVKGLSKLMLRGEVIKKTVGFLLLFSALPLGMKAVCWSVTIYCVWDSLVVIYYAKKALPTTYRDQLKAVAPIFWLTLALAVAFALISFTLESGLLRLAMAFFLLALIVWRGGLLLKIKEVLDIHRKLFTKK